MIESTQHALVGLSAFIAFGISATGSAIGCGRAAAAAIGSWKRCYAQGRPAPFQLTIFSGVAMTQTIYGLILMLQIVGMHQSMWLSALAVGILGGIGIGASAAYQGRAAAGACDSFAETGKGFVNDLIAIGVVETIAIFTMVFAIMFISSQNEIAKQLVEAASAAL
ncbi:MAG: V-type ATP synthase subunit K [Lentisphaeria bacterium]|nr:V-type ATP synthase subunit K [Lentisphaeria bacterium]